MLWSLIRSVGPLVRDRLVALWVVDPKGGMELSAGEPLFARFAYDATDSMAKLLEEAVAEMRARAARLRGRVRLHTPSTDEPLIVVLAELPRVRLTRTPTHDSPLTNHRSVPRTRRAPRCAIWPADRHLAPRRWHSKR